MITVNTHEAKTRMSQLLAAVGEKNETVLICRNGKPIARLIAAADEGIDPLEPHSELKVTFAPGFDPVAPAEDADWPDEAR